LTHTVVADVHSGNLLDIQAVFLLRDA